jgi:hypothetical protein
MLPQKRGVPQMNADQTTALAAETTQKRADYNTHTSEPKMPNGEERLERTVR